MNINEVADFFDDVDNGKTPFVRFTKSINPLQEIVVNDKTLSEAKAWLNLSAVTSYMGGNEKGVLISMTRIDNCYLVFEKIVDSTKQSGNNTLIKNEVLCKTYENNADAVRAIIKSITNYGRERASQLITFIEE